MFSFLQKLVRGTPGRRVPSVPHVITDYSPPQVPYSSYQVPRVHGSNHPPSLRGNTAMVNNAGVHFFDSGNPVVHQIPDQSLQRHFRQSKNVPAQEILVPANGVFVPPLHRSRGWKQAFVPWAGMRQPLAAAAQPLLLNQPLKVKQVSDTMNYPKVNGKAQPLKRRRA